MTSASRILTTCREPLPQALLVLAACWAAAYLGPLSYLVIPVLLGACVVVARRRDWIRLALLLCLNPVSGSLIGGAMDYFAGAPTLHTKNVPGIEGFNVDPATRAFLHDDGAPDHDDWLTLPAHNAAVRLMCHCFGPSTNAYDGPYPTRDEALAKVNRRILTPAYEFKNGLLLADDVAVRIVPSAAEHLGKLVDLKNDTANEVRAALYQDRCIVVRLALLKDPGHPDAGFVADYLALVDRDTQRPFAYYRLTGPESPPVVPPGYVR